jgi:AcrR family transcriptional regulator
MTNNNTYHLIKQKARELFFSYGLKSVSMDDIAKQSGISKRTIYQFFEDKKNIVDAVVSELIQVHEQLFKTAHSTSGDAIDEVLKQEAVLSQICKGLRPSFFLELENFFPDTWDELEQYKQKIYKGIIENLHRGKQEGLYRQDIDVKLISDLRLHQLINILRPELLTSLHLGSKNLAGQFTSLYLNAITTEKGKKILEQYLSKNSQPGR